MLTDEMIAFDNLRHTMKVMVMVHRDQIKNPAQAYAEAEQKIEKLKQRISRPVSTEMLPHGQKHPCELKAELTCDEFCSMVEKAKQHIIAGDVIQIVLSQRFSAKLPASPLTIYRALRQVNPSP